ncbi:hypothetical protein HELRODRAFT_138282, partial [Helobdella robusta]|uniref:J domain-containing protein n=1 Tax=Helobdella robusta TaxID=6412 RepID=T1EIS7_HELRO
SKNSKETYYDLLEISEKASQVQIKAAYYRLSKKYHPDTSSELDSRYKFARLNEAYKTLSNVKHRRNYD